MGKYNIPKMTNCEKIKSFLAQVEQETKYHVIKKKFNEGYILTYGQDSTCSFEIKEIPGFLFGLWSVKNVQPDTYTCVNPDDELIFFAQYKRDLDKFKPSHSGYVLGTRRYVWEEQKNGEELELIMEWSIDRIVAALKFMHKHPIKAYYCVGFETPYVWNMPNNNLKLLAHFIDSWCYYWKSQFKYWIHLKYIIHHSLKLAKSLKYYYVNVRDFGDSCSPRIWLELRQKDQTLDESNVELVKENNRIDKFENKYFNDISLDYLQHDDKKTDNRAKKLFIQHLKSDADLDIMILYCNYNIDTIL